MAKRNLNLIRWVLVNIENLNKHQRIVFRTIKRLKYRKIFLPQRRLTERTNHQTTCKLPTYSLLSGFTCNSQKHFSFSHKIKNYTKLFRILQKTTNILDIPLPLTSCNATSRPANTCFARFPNFIFLSSSSIDKK